MSAFFRPLIALTCIATLGRAQTPAASAPPTPPAEKEHVERLDKYVVSVGPDPKSSFDLAQGTSVLTGDDLRKAAQSTLGQTLASTPGVASTYYGPGASRPIIRGLGGDRVRVLDHGVGALDASSVSPDHNTALEPLFASRIEVLRGPSTLLYGGSAVGGVVNVIDNTIPDAAPEKPFSGALELRGGGASDERTGVLSAGGGSTRFAFRLNALKQKTDDLRIPGVARIDANAAADQPDGTLPDSATDTESFALGGTLFGTAGHLGASASRYETEYGVPTDEPGISIRMKQRRLDLDGEITQPFAIFRGLEARVGFGDYTHSEVSDGTTINTTFENKAWEGRAELPHIAVGNLTGTLGVQAARSDFAAIGEEVVTPPYLTESAALFALEEWKLTDAASIQFGGRYERQSIELGEVDPDLPAVPGYDAVSNQKKKSGGLSGSLGVVTYPAKDWSLGAALAYTERLPTAQELFSNGPHAGTGAYEVGSTGLGKERSLGLDVSLRRRAGRVTGSVSAFVNRFNDYIFEEELDPAAIPAENNEDGLTPYQFVARDARFYGAEAEVLFHLLDRDEHHLHLTLMADTVRALQTTDDEPLPRIPPLRYGAKLAYHDDRWAFDVEARRTTSQRRIAANESETPAYTLLNASVSYLIPTSAVTYELFARGYNLTDAEAREHTSFLKEFAPLPGRGVTLGLRVSF